MSLRRTFQGTSSKIQGLLKTVQTLKSLLLFAEVSSKSKEEQGGLKDNWLAYYKHF